MATSPLLVYDAMVYAHHLHRDHTRAYTGLPYVTHLAEVAGLVASVAHTDTMLAAAWLHDSLEDTDTAEEYLTVRFGGDVASMVMHLSDHYSSPEHGSRFHRKRMEADRLGECDWMTKTIKIADVISNVRDIVSRDPSFARVYIREKAYLLDKLKDGDAGLWMMAHRMVYKAADELKVGL